MFCPVLSFPPFVAKQQGIWNPLTSDAPFPYLHFLATVRILALTSNASKSFPVAFTQILWQQQLPSSTSIQAWCHFSMLPYHPATNQL